MSIAIFHKFYIYIIQTLPSRVTLKYPRVSLPATNRRPISP